MAVIALKGSTAVYTGKEWEHRRNKKMILQQDTRTTSVQYKFLFVDENITAMVNYENFDWIKKVVECTADHKPPVQTPTRLCLF